MPSPLSSVQLELLRRALYAGALENDQGAAADLSVLTRAGLLRDSGDGRKMPTEAGRRYAASIFGDSCEDPP